MFKKIALGLLIASFSYIGLINLEVLSIQQLVRQGFYKISLEGEVKAHLGLTPSLEIINIKFPYLDESENGLLEKEVTAVLKHCVLILKPFSFTSFNVIGQDFIAKDKKALLAAQEITGQVALEGKTVVLSGVNAKDVTLTSPGLALSSPLAQGGGQADFTTKQLIFSWSIKQCDIKTLTLKEASFFIKPQTSFSFSGTLQAVMEKDQENNYLVKAPNLALITPDNGYFLKGQLSITEDQTIKTGSLEFKIQKIEPLMAFLKERLPRMASYFDLGAAFLKKDKDLNLPISIEDDKWFLNIYGFKVGL